MKKITLGPQTLVYPMPAFLIGANVGERPNFMTAAWSGIAASTPPMITRGPSASPVHPERNKAKMAYSP